MDSNRLRPFRNIKMKRSVLNSAAFVLIIGFITFINPFTVVNASEILINDNVSTDSKRNPKCQSAAEGAGLTDMTGMYNVYYVGSANAYELTYEYSAQKFDISAIRGIITSAKLKLYVVEVNGTPTVDLLESSDDSWNESDLPSATFPAFNSSDLIYDSTIGSSALYDDIPVSTSDQWLTFNVTDYIQKRVNEEASNVIFVQTGVTGPSDNDFAYVTNHHGDITYWPRLEITYIPAPKVQSVSLTSSSNHNYKTGETIGLQVDFNKAVNVIGTRIPLTLGSGETVYADYSGGTGTANISYSYTVQSGDGDNTGITIGDKIELNGGSIIDADTNAATNGGNSERTMTGLLPVVSDVKVDGTIPTVNSLSPLDNANNVGVNNNLVINFSENVVVGTGNITIKKTSDNSIVEVIDVTGAKVSGGGTGTITINPATTLDGETGYYVVIDSTAFTDTAGNSYTGISSNSVWNYTTADVTAPVVNSISPLDNAINVGVNDNLIINFSENVVVGTGNITIKKTTDDSVVEVIDVTGAKVTGSGTSIITVNPATTLDGETGYYVVIDSAAFTDTAGNSYAGINSSSVWNFTTADVTAPVVNGISPLHNAINVGVNDNLVINFSENVVVGTGNITIKKTSDDSIVEAIDVTGAKVTGGNTSIITVNPATTLDGETGYYVVIDSTVFTDAAGNGYAGISSSGVWNFTTADVTAPTVSSIERYSPAGEFTNAASVTYRVTFSEAVTGVDASDFALTKTGTADGTVASVSAGSGAVIDVTVNSITGDGTLRLDLNSAGTGIIDNAGIAIAVGYISGQTYTIDTGAPIVSLVSVPSNGTYITGYSLNFTVNYNEAVTVNTAGGTPYIDISFNIGGTVHANYTGGSGTNALIFSYTVAGGYEDTDGITVGSTITENGGTLKDAVGNSAVLTLNSVGPTAGVLVDSAAPVVLSAGVPTNGTYLAGQSLDFTVNFNEVVTVNTAGGTPYIVIVLNTGGTVHAAYTGGSGTSALTFRYTVASGNEDTDGITVGSTITENGGTIKDAAGNNSVPALIGVGLTTGVLVDGIVPVVSSVSVPFNGTYAAGQSLDFTVNYSEAVTVNTAGGTPYIEITLNAGGTVHAAYVSGSGTSALIFRYTVASGNEDTDGITVGSAVTENGSILKDAVGNDAVLTLNSVGATSMVLVDATAPVVNSIERYSPAGEFTNAASVTYRVTFSEAVTGVDASDFALTKTGTADGTVAAVSAGSGAVIDVTVNGITGDGTLRLDLNSAGTGIIDNAGNAIAAGYISGQTYTIDTGAPIVSLVSVPSNGTYITGQSLNFTVNYSEAVTVNTAGGTPYIEIALNTGGTVHAAYIGGSGTNALIFSYTVAGGYEDTDGITVGSTITENGGTLKDAVGNSAVLTLNSVGPTAGVLVDSAAPVVFSAGVPANGTYLAGQSLDFTVNFNEAVTVNTAGGTPYIVIVLNTGGTVHAAYIGGSGTNALIFRYTVASGNKDADGITVGSTITENGGTIKDAAGNNSVPALIGVGLTTGVLVDGIVPVVSSVSVPSNGTYAAGQNLDFTVNYSEAVIVNTAGGTPYIEITLNAGGTVHAAYLSGSGTSALTFRYTVASGNEDTDGITVGSTVTENGGILKDAVGNDAVLTLNSVEATSMVLVDATAPVVNSIERNSPAGETTNAASVTYRVTFSEAVTGVDASDFALTKTGTADGIVASVSAGSGTVIDVTVNSITGDGTLRLDLNSTGTGITDNAGNAIAAGYTSGQTYTIDTGAPTGGSISINGGTDYTNSTTVSLTLSSAGASDMKISENSSFTGASYEEYTGSKTFILSSGDGIKTVYVKFKDAAGNETSTTISDSITLDTTGPAAPSVTGTTPTDNNKPTWTWATGGSGGNGTYRYKLDSTDLSSGLTTTSTSYTSVDGLSDGTHILYVQERDEAGNWSDIGSFTITIDTRIPYISGISNNAIYNTDVIPTFTEGTATIAKNGGSPIPFIAGTVISEEGSYTITLSYIPGKATSVSFTIDKTAPTDCNITVNSGADYTDSNIVTLTLSATGASLMKISESSDFNSVSYETYKSSKSFTLSNGNGVKTVFVKFKDAAGNETSTTISDSIILEIKAVTYTVTYDGNGSSSGSVPTDSNSYSNGDTVAVAGNSGNLAKTGYTFAGWNTAADGSGITYTADSGTFVISVNTVLYAKWTINSASTAADLSSLSITPRTLSPDFSANKTEYTVSMSNSNSAVTVTASVYDANATMKINGVAPSVIDAVYGKYVATIDLKVGVNKIYVEVTAQDGITKKTYTITATRASSHKGSSGATNSDSTTTDNNTAKVVVNGEEYTAGTISKITKGTQTVTTVTVEDKKIEALLSSKGNNITIEIPIYGTTDIAEGVLNGQIIKDMEAKEAVLVVKTGTISYTLPASEIDIDSVSKELGTQASLKDIAVHVAISTPPADTIKIVSDTAGKNSYKIVVSPVEFEITCTNGDKTVSLSKFNSYVERTIAIPEGVDPSKITTGVVLNTDGTFTHVPTQIIIIDGKYYAKISSLTNSTYSVIYNPIEFKDVENHWAKNDINDMGSRLVINGIGGEDFAPDRDITRAEFAAIIVRALGLKAGSGASGFDDVKTSDWYNGYIKTAVEYGIVSGYGNGSFGPMDKITREQAMTMLARAMKKTGLKEELSAGEVEELLANYADRNVSSEYARNSIAKCIKTGVVSGRSSTELAPDDSISRAEVAVMVRRLLKKSGLI